MMEVATGFPRDVIALIWHEKLTEHDDHGDLTPEQRDSCAGKHDIRLLAKLTGLQQRQRRMPALEDLAQGVGQWHDVGRIAVVTDEPLFRHMVQFFGPFFHSPIRVFSNAQSREARNWLQSYQH